MDLNDSFLQKNEGQNRLMINKEMEKEVKWKENKIKVKKRNKCMETKQVRSKVSNKLKGRKKENGPKAFKVMNL